ncbi:hypothetical protein [Bacillus cereus group sp. N6]|nr:hypothetical protein [Bacillus cereus group sp. N6]
MPKENILKSFFKSVESCSNSEEEYNQFIEAAFDIEQIIKK